ncbi:MAG: hypothetical protein QNJ12_21345 [Ilumatobacter sp.]|uniref:hypothetical protein n=1 Tax=Ilumatobacter sp. TaxID=1967498 RepID=UPI002630C161|nr:hypothetical protein [Ilumatobacter sp.]MDJ0771345.1 hypothetical protein [Ilumatobacter sp.]
MSPSDEQPDHFAGPPLGVDTVVRFERGRWVVDIAVTFPEGVVRRTVNDYATEREATIAANWIRRGADRDIDGPVNG